MCLPHPAMSASSSPLTHAPFRRPTLNPLLNRCYFLPFFPYSVEEIYLCWTFTTKTSFILSSFHHTVSKCRILSYILQTVSHEHCPYLPTLKLSHPNSTSQKAGVCYVPTRKTRVPALSPLSPGASVAFHGLSARFVSVWSVRAYNCTHYLSYRALARVTPSNEDLHLLISQCKYPYPFPIE